ncbi:hypothetical protein RMCBS344292_15434 [Rhizopus microsporus]|nr:hypothetical protein RMCBS344292_15434 [Rhizopus microsporus]
MSVTVPISMKMFNTHLNLYNKFHSDNSLPVVKAKEKYLQLPKAFKITAAEINHSSLKNKFQYCIEKQKKNTVISSIESSLSLLSKEVQPANVMSLKRYFVVAMKERQTLRNFYYGKKISRQRRTLEVKNRTVKDRVTSKERKFVLQGSKTLHPVMAIGNQGLGVGSTIRGYDRRGGKWLQRKHERHATAIITDEHMTSQFCIYYYNPLVHPVLGTSRCLNPDCPAFKCGRATNNRDVMSAAAIGISAMTKIILKKDLPPFCPKLSLQL